MVACKEHTTGVDEDFHGTVVGVFVGQGNHNVGSRMGGWVSICPDGMRKALHSWIEKSQPYKYIKYTYILKPSGFVQANGQLVSRLQSVPKLSNHPLIQNFKQL